MTDMVSISRASLEQIYKTIGSHLGAEVAAALAKTTKVSKAAAKAEKSEKKPRANAGQSTAWAAFSSKIQAEHKDEVALVKADAAAKRKAAKDAGLAAPAETQGAHLHWCSEYKKAHDAEWLAFKAAWEVEHPKAAKGSRATSAAASVVDDAASAAPSVASGDAAPKKRRGAKKDSECTPAELAERKAKRAANKAKKAAAAAAAAKPDAEAASGDDEVEEEEAVEVAVEEEEGSVEVETEDTLIPWTSPKGVSYLRVGHLDEEGDGVWNEGNWLWAVKEDGSRGAFAGVLLANGKVDTKAKEPEIE